MVLFCIHTGSGVARVDVPAATRLGAIALAAVPMEHNANTATLRVFEFEYMMNSVKMTK